MTQTLYQVPYHALKEWMMVLNRKWIFAMPKLIMRTLALKTSRSILNITHLWHVKYILGDNNYFSSTTCC